MVETYELLRPLRDENTDITYTCAEAHICMRPLTRITSNRAVGACKLQNHLIWEIGTDQQDDRQRPDTQLLFHHVTVLFLACSL